MFKDVVCSSDIKCNLRLHSECEARTIDNICTQSLGFWILGVLGEVRGYVLGFRAQGFSLWLRVEGFRSGLSCYGLLVCRSHCRLGRTSREGILGAGCGRLVRMLGV